MCGFIQRITDSPDVIALLEEVGLTRTIPLFANESSSSNVINFYPAFGKTPERQITNLIVSGDSTIDATWWFDAKPVGDSLMIGDRTTFNARNLDSPYWGKFIRERRAVVVATAVGESNPVGKGKAHYLMKPTSGALLIGAVYRRFSNGLFSCAVVTRPPVEGFSQYHEKSIPCFLPHNSHAINSWLAADLQGALNAEVEYILNNPRIYSDIEVTRVNTFKGAEVIGEVNVLKAE
ncbi:SOS response-associated peptidase family protein [Alteromonas sp. S015]|uniref:SOS response-associated peptidase family protein n=1 Tax=Alteromonas sp. S015 TaxID=3117401 RepID=UPI002FE3A6EF